MRSRPLRSSILSNITSDFLWSASQPKPLLHVLCRQCRQHVRDHLKAPDSETGGPERVLLVKGHHAWLAPQIKHTEQHHRQILWSASQGDVMLHLLCRGCRQHV